MAPHEVAAEAGLRGELVQAPHGVRAMRAMRAARARAAGRGPRELVGCRLRLFSSNRTTYCPVLTSGTDSARDSEHFEG